MLPIARVDLSMLAAALGDQGWEHEYTFDPETGEILYWSHDLGEKPDEDALRIEALPSRVWYRDMADFTGRLTDQRAAEQLERALDGRGAFRRFANEIHQRQPDLITPWNAFRNARAERRAVVWLRDNNLIDEAEADRYLDDHPDQDVP